LIHPLHENKLSDLLLQFLQACAKIFKNSWTTVFYGAASLKLICPRTQESLLRNFVIIR